MANNNIKAINFDYIKDNLLRDTARMAAAESVKFFKESFVNGGFTDGSLQKWPDGKSPLGGKRTMYGTGTLMQSIRATEIAAKRVTVASDTAYSEIHNEGGTVTVTARMKKFWWAQYMKWAGKVGITKTGRASGSQANRKTSAKAEFCRRMALMKVGSKIKIPRRQFLGESRTLMNRLDGELQVKIAEYWGKA